MTNRTSANGFSYPVIRPCVDSQGHFFIPHDKIICCKRCGLVREWSDVYVRA